MEVCKISSEIVLSIFSKKATKPLTKSSHFMFNKVDGFWKGHKIQKNQKWRWGRCQKVIGLFKKFCGLFRKHQLNGIFCQILVAFLGLQNFKNKMIQMQHQNDYDPIVNVGGFCPSPPTKVSGSLASQDSILRTLVCQHLSLLYLAASESYNKKYFHYLKTFFMSSW